MEVLSRKARVLILLLLAGAFFRGSADAQNQQAALPPFPRAFVDAAIERTNHRVIYDGSYRPIHYPGGDVPDSIGVCSDVVIRSYRALGVDLQKLVHEDMNVAFDEYPSKWGLQKPDANIDHRRVLNLQTFLRRQDAEFPVTDNPADYKPGDLVTWLLPGNLPHIGIVTDRRLGNGRRPLIVHNIGRGTVLEDMLFSYDVTGHYRYRLEREATDGMIAYHHAPVHYQQTDRDRYKEDYITRFDYDGNWLLRDNWDNLDKGDLSAYVYYSVVESETHWFILYAFYHPRDWADKIWRDEHENDLEGFLSVVRKDGTRFGSLEGMLTVFHEHFIPYAPAASRLKSGQREFGGPLTFEQVGAIPRVTTCQESKGHGLRAFPPLDGFPSGEESSSQNFIKYYPSLDGAEAPQSGRDRHVKYKLIDLFEQGELWDRQLSDLMIHGDSAETFYDWGRLKGGKEIQGRWTWELSANAPWGWDDEEDKEIFAGEIALDPIHVADVWFNGLGDFSHTYLRNQYLGDLADKGFDQSNLPRGWPDRLDLKRMLTKLRILQ